MKKMTIEEINHLTLGEGISSPLCVYEMIEDGVICIDLDGDSSTLPEVWIDLKKGDLIARAGCGSLSKTFPMSYFRYKDRWGRVANRSVRHYANPILEDVKVQE